jgi:hypothetical protein
MTKRSPNGSRSSKKSSASRYKTRGQRVEVQWEDAYKESRWSHDPEQHKPLICNNLGWVVFHDKRGIMLCDSNHKNDDGTTTVGGRHFIPKGMIRQINYV